MQQNSIKVCRNQQDYSKMCMEIIRTQFSQNSLKTEQIQRTKYLPNSLAYYETTIIKVVHIGIKIEMDR